YECLLLARLSNDCFRRLACLALVKLLEGRVGRPRWADCGSLLPNRDRLQRAPCALQSVARWKWATATLFDRVTRLIGHGGEATLTSPGARLFWLGGSLIDLLLARHFGGERYGLGLELHREREQRSDNGILLISD